MRAPHPSCWLRLRYKQLDRVVVLRCPPPILPGSPIGPHSHVGGYTSRNVIRSDRQQERSRCVPQREARLVPNYAGVIAPLVELAPASSKRRLERDLKIFRTQPSCNRYPTPILLRQGVAAVENRSGLSHVISLKLTRGRPSPFSGVYTYVWCSLFVTSRTDVHPSYVRGNQSSTCRQQLLYT